MFLNVLFDRLVITLLRNHKAKTVLRQMKTTVGVGKSACIHGATLFITVLAKPLGHDEIQASFMDHSFVTLWPPQPADCTHREYNWALKERPRNLEISHMRHYCLSPRKLHPHIIVCFQLIYPTVSSIYHASNKCLHLRICLPESLSRKVKNILSLANHDHRSNWQGPTRRIHRQSLYDHASSLQQRLRNVESS